VAITQGLRLAGWHSPGVWRIPMLWVLYTAFGWLVIGFSFKALVAAGWFPPNLAVHALTVGGVGVLTFGMMARVTLGHTGRDMKASVPIVAAFALLNLGAAARVFGPLLVPGNYTGTVHLAGGLWLLAFLALAWIHAPMLVRPRADGRPG
jgi:uncharacterized protein involved in response to NO